MLKNKRMLSFILMSTILVTTLLTTNSTVLAAEKSNITNETISERELSLDEYKNILVNDLNISEAEATRRISEHSKTRGNVHKLYAVSKRKTKRLDSNYKLLCMVTIYVWRDTSTMENLEIDHASAPYIGLSGNTINSDFDGTAEADDTTKKVTVDYNGQIYFEVEASIDLSWAIPLISTSTTIKYKYPVSGAFTWSLSEV